MRIAVVLVLLAACGKNTEPPPPSSGSPNARPESGPSAKRPSAGATAASGDIPEASKVLFANVCATCHGADGTGNGPAAAALNPKPRNYTDPAWQASVTDDQIKEIILMGGANLGKSPAMPSHTLLRDRPEVLDGLVKIIRGFGKRP
jgi:cytochrome c553